jgi:hypothetical protein
MAPLIGDIGLIGSDLIVAGLSTNMPGNSLTRSQSGSSTMSAIKDTSTRTPTNREKQDGGGQARYGQNKDDKCGSCGIVVLDTDRSLECEICKFWHHIDCEEVPILIYEAIENDPSGILHWYCRKCNCSVVKIIEQVSSLDKRQSATEAKVRDIDMRVEDLESKVTDTNDSLDRINSTFDDVVNTKMEDTLRELQDRDRRKGNIIVFGVGESSNEDSAVRLEHDFKAVQDLGKAVDIENIEVDRIYRLGTVNSENKFFLARPMKVVLKQHSAKGQILRQSKTLRDKGGKWKDWYVKPDRTPKAREGTRALLAEIETRRAQGEQDLGIRYGQIVQMRKDRRRPAPLSQQRKDAGRLAPRD